MKSLIVLSLFAALTAQAQNFSPSAGAFPNSTAPSGAGTILNQGSPSATGTGFTSPSATLDSTAPVGASTILGDGRQTLDQTNTAPTPIPEDTSLIQTPSNDPLQQSQQEAPFGTIPTDSGTTPGSESGTGTGTTTSGSGSGTEPAPTTTPFNSFPETTR